MAMKKARGISLTIGALLISLSVVLVVSSMTLLYAIGTNRFELFDATSKYPWRGMSATVSDNRVGYHFFLMSYSTYEECKEDVLWKVTQSTTQAYKEPAGCAYKSNSRFSSALAFYFSPDRDHYACLIRSKNPKSEQWQARYTVVLEIYPEGCLTDSTQEVIATHKDNPFLILFTALLKAIF